MKKTLLFCIIVLTLFALSACQNRNNHIEFDYQVLRTSEHKADNLPIATIISSRYELEQYYINVCRGTHHSPDEFAALCFQAIEKNPDEFFENNYLVIVLLEERSGSIRHEVKSIDKRGRITINRLLPSRGSMVTQDMAEWHIVIELGNGFHPEQFNVILKDKTAA